MRPRREIKRYHCSSVLIETAGGCLEPVHWTAVDFAFDSLGLNSVIVLILDQPVRKGYAHQKIAQQVAVCGCLQVHPFSELPLDVDFDSVGLFRAGRGVGLISNPVGVEQLICTGVAKTAAVKKLERPVGTLIEQYPAGRKEIAAIRGHIIAESQIQLPSRR